MNGGVVGRFIVTGTGRSGTGFVAATLNRSGVRCGHEQIYGGRKSKWISKPFISQPSWGEFQAECSWLAAPIRVPYPKFLVVRHPLEVVQSCVETGELRKMSAYNQYRQRVLPFIWHESSELNRALMYWTHWNLIAEIDSKAVFLLHRLDEDSFARMANIRAEWVTLASNDTNSKENYPHRVMDKPPEWSDFNPGLARIAQALWQRYESTTS